MSLGTGKVLSEMVEGRKVSADVRELGLKEREWKGKAKL